MDGMWVLGTSAAPVRPQVRIAPGQALYSTYASRMRAGTTTLMQPIYTGGHELEASTSLRHRASLYYEDDNTDDSDEYVDSEEEEYSAQRSKRSRGESESGQAESQDIHPTDVEAQAESAPPGSQLGLPVPSNRLVVRPATRTQHAYFKEQQLNQQGETPEILVPIRIEFHTDTHRIKDVFMWNLNERLVTPYQFAQTFLQDLALPTQPYATQIENSIVQQLTDAKSVLDADGEGLSRIIEMKSASLERKRQEVEAQKRRMAMAQTQATGNVDANGTSLPRKRGRPRKYPLEASKPVAPSTPTAGTPPAVATPITPFAESTPVVLARTTPSPPETQTSKSKEEQDPKEQEKAQIHARLASIDAEDDIRVIVEYEVQLSRHMLRDRLEWDLGSSLTPEAFSKTLLRDLGLPLESGVLISHAIREQLLHHRRAAQDLGLFGSGKIYKCTMDELVAINKMEQQQQRIEAGMDLDLPEEREEDEAAQHRQAMEAAIRAVEADDVSALIREESAPPHTRSRRMAAGGLTITDASMSVPFVVPDASLPLPIRRQQALATLRDLLALGPRPLEGVWRDFTEASDFGPLLEYLSDAELEKMEEAQLRASRYVSYCAQERVPNSSSAVTAATRSASDDRVDSHVAGHVKCSFKKFSCKSRVGPQRFLVSRVGTPLRPYSLSILVHYGCVEPCR